MESVFEYINNSDQSVALEIFLGIAICALIYAIIYIIKLVGKKSKSGADDSPVILNGLVDGQYSREVVQNPNEEYSKTLTRSQNESGGIEYTYSLWMYINDESFKETNKDWHHVFHKGPKIEDFSREEPEKISQIQAPGLWLSGKRNTMRLYVNSFDSANEYVEISNLPVKKWIHLVYTQSNFVSNIYVNGRLKTTHTLTTLPRQNYYDLYLTQNGGFQGYLSSMQYFNYSLPPSLIYDLNVKGPSLTPNTDPSAQQDDGNSYMDVSAPYLSNRWWVDDVTKN